MNLLYRLYRILTGALLLVTATVTAHAAEEPSRDLLLPPAGKVLLGAFTTMEEAATESRFREYGRTAGKDPAIHLIFRDWSLDESSNFPTEFSRTSIRLGAIPMVSWEPWFDYGRDGYPLLRDIADGKHDPYMKAFLRDAARLEHPWFLRFAHEMEARTYPWTKAVDARQSPSDYAAAFRHVSELARKIAPKTVVVWSPNSGSSNAERYYPGSEWVDWIGASLYNFPGAPQAPDHHDKLDGWTKMLRKLGKPGMIAEMGCAEHYTISEERLRTRAPGTPALESWMDLSMADKSVCLDRTFDAIEARYPDILALVWFDINKDADWRIDSSDKALQTFRHRVASPRYQGAYTAENIPAW